MKPEVSIIITTFNYGKFIKETLHSILKQTYSNYEILIIDDGSTDNTSDIVSEWEEPFKGRLRYFYKENQGVAIARNYGIFKAKGDYIAFVDADDIWFEDSLQKLVSCIKDNADYGLVYGNVRMYDITFKKNFGLRFQTGSYPAPFEGKCFDKLFIHGNFIHTSASIVRRQVFEKAGFFDERFRCGEDLDMWIRLSAIFEIKYLDEILTKVRRHHSSLSFSLLSAHKSKILMTRKLLKLMPDFETVVGPEKLKNFLYENYYAMGVYCILEGMNKKGRRWLQKAWRLEQDPFKNKMIFYSVLSYLPCSNMLRKLRPSKAEEQKLPQERIKIMHIIKTLSLGGAETNLFNLARTFNNRFFDVHVAYSSTGELEESFKRMGIKLFKFADKPAKIKSVDSIKIIWRLVKYIKRENIKIVHTHTFNAHLWGGLAAKLAGCKIIEHVHDSRYIDPLEFEKRGEKNQQYRFIKFLRNFSDQVVVLTKQNRDFIIKNSLYRPEDVHEIQNGIDLKAAKELSSDEKISLKKKLGLPLDSKIILTPIRFSPEKNLDVLFHIAADVSTLLSDVVFVIAGNGPEQESFESRVKSYGLQERIKTIGFYPDIPELLTISDIFLLPSTIELHSIAIMEAMRQKVPVITSKNVGCNDKFIRHWKNGILLDPFSKKGWGNCIITLLQDDDLRRYIGEQGYKTVVEEFDIRDVAKKFEDLYENLLSV